MSNNLDALPDDVAMAREYAVLGAYTSSLALYDRAAQSIARYLRDIVDTTDRGKWSRVREDLVAEARLVKEIMRELTHFRIPPGSGSTSNTSGGEFLNDEENGEGQAPSTRRQTGSGVAGAGRARGRGPAFQFNQSNDDNGGGGNSKIDDDTHDGREKDDGRWSPPPPKEKPRASSVGPQRGAELPAWERKQHQQPSTAGRGVGNAIAPNRPSLGKQGGGGGGGGGGQSTNSSSAVPTGSNVGRPPKQLMKAPLPPQAKARALNSSSSQSQSQQQQQGRGVSSGVNASSNPSRSSINGSSLSSSSSSYSSPSDIDNANGGAPPPRPRYSEVHRGAVDSDLIERLEREMLDLAPNVKWSDIAGLDDAKGVLQEAVVLPMMLRNFFSGVRKPWRGVLLYGPPGTGKTLLAKAVATECRTTFFNVSASSLASKWRGDGEKLVRILFDMAKYYAPTVVFFDEVDSIASKRSDGEQDASRRMKTEMLVCMDGISNDTSSGVSEGGDEGNEGGEDGGGGGGEGDMTAAGSKIVMVLGATNQPWELDDAFKRRFEKRIYIPLPGPEERKVLLRLCLQKIKLADGIDTDALASLLNNYSGADIAVVCKHAAYAPMRHKQAEVQRKFPRADQMRERVLAIQAAEAEIMNAGITQTDFEEAIAANKPSASGGNLKHFEEYARDHGST
jgi:katanin p60 ATPase-containing subunit A1